MFRLTVCAQAWPTESKTYTHEADSLFGLRKFVRSWREFDRYEDNYVTSMRVVEIDKAHEADMAKLRREQLAADIDVDEANEELLDDIPFDDFEF